jgi:hypothetical protein
MEQLKTNLALLEEDILLSSSTVDGRNSHDEEVAVFFRIPLDPVLLVKGQYRLRGCGDGNSIGYE